MELAIVCLELATFCAIITLACSVVSMMIDFFIEYPKSRFKPPKWTVELFSYLMTGTGTLMFIFAIAAIVIGLVTSEWKG